MGLMSFIKDAGEKLFGKGEAKAAQEAVAQAPSPENLARLNQAAGDAIAAYINTQGLTIQALAVGFDGATGTVTVSGQAPDQATKEKVLLCCGNVQHVVAVDDQLTVAKTEPGAKYYTVVKGDTLSKVAKEFYGNANKYPVIFEATARCSATRTRSTPVRCCAFRRPERCGHGPSADQPIQRIDPTPPMARTAPAPIAAPKRFASRSARFSLGV